MESLLGRISTLFKAKIHTRLNDAENPNETLDWSYEQQVEQLQNVRRGIADVVTAKARLQLQLAHLQQDSGQLDNQAGQALQANREDLARLALSRKADVAQQLQGLRAQVETLATQQEQLQAGEQRLAAKIEAFRTRKETIKAQYTAAQAQVRIGEAASGISEEMADVHAALQRAEDKTLTMQARANAIEELTAAGTLPDLLTTSGDDVQAQLDQISAGNTVDADLAALKARIGQGTPVAQLGEHTTSSGPIVRVQGSGQYRLAQPEMEALRSLDRLLAEAVRAHDGPRFHALLSQMITMVRTQGSRLEPDEVVSSETILPPDTLTVEEAAALLHDDGLLDGPAMPAQA